MLLTNNNIKELVNAITFDSCLFGDEEMSVYAQLNSLLSSANAYGCEITGEIEDCWGGTVTVTAVPATRKHEWFF